MRNLFIALSLTFIGVNVSYAECLYNGEVVPAGTEISGLVCQEDGSWE